MLLQQMRVVKIPAFTNKFGSFIPRGIVRTIRLPSNFHPSTVCCRIYFSLGVDALRKPVWMDYFREVIGVLNRRIEYLPSHAN